MISDKPLRIERSRFRDIFGRMGNFSGCLKIYFKDPELSKSDVLILDGVIKTAKTMRIKSRTVIRGDDDSRAAKGRILYSRDIPHGKRGSGEACRFDVSGKGKRPFWKDRN